MWDNATDNLECGVVWYKVILYRNESEEKNITTMDLNHNFTELDDGTNYAIIVISVNNAGNTTSNQEFATTFGETLIIMVYYLSLDCYLHGWSCADMHCLDMTSSYD